MLDDTWRVPPSPPTSPRMSDTGAKIDIYQWQQGLTAATDTAVAERPIEVAQDSTETSKSLTSPTVRNREHTRPLLRPYNTFPYLLPPSSRSNVQNEAGSSSRVEVRESTDSAGSQRLQGNGDPQQPTFGGSAPTSPVDRFTPGSPTANHDETPMEDEDVDIDILSEEEGGFEEVGRPPMTAAELRAHKRKMKRFRLTHNQTRFLMSEFARQAHPDAAHRERLSREIPGLSPRQVQVWFQNRRAKLKRLTTDDRERVMRSRALPANFDMTQALHGPFGAPTPNTNTSSANPSALAHFGSASGMRPLTLDTLRRASEYPSWSPKYATSSGVTPALGALAFTPPQSATETISPGSAAFNMSPFGFPTQQSPRRQPLDVTYGSQTGFTGHFSHMSRVQTQDRVPRASGDVSASPLRTSISSSALASSNTYQGQQKRAQTFSEDPSHSNKRPRQSRSITNPNMGNQRPSGLGFSYTPTSNNQLQPTAQGSQPPGSQPAMSFAQYRRNSSHLAGAPIVYPQYAVANFSTCHMPQYNASYAPHLFQPPYPPQSLQMQQQHEASQSRAVQTPQQIYTPITYQHQQFTPMPDSTAEAAELGDNSDGGVSLQPGY